MFLVEGEYTCPSLINKRAIAVAFQQLKVPFVIGFGSVGGIIFYFLIFFLFFFSLSIFTHYEIL